MDSSCLQYALTSNERQTFERDGYLVVPDALPPEKLSFLLDLTDRLHADGTLQKRAAVGTNSLIAVPDFVGIHPGYFDMIDYPRMFPKVWGILGWNIFLYHSHLVITSQTKGTFDPNGKTFGWHQDSGRLNVDMETNPRPRLSLKVGYFLTDLTEPGRGNFWVIPGSHMKNVIDMPPGGMGQPKGAIPVLVKPGAAVIFDRRLWHSATVNYSPITRKFLVYGYGYRWIRPRDELTIPKKLYDAADPIRKQILGYSTNEIGRSSPKDDDVPLRVWLRQHQPEEAAR